MPTPAFIAERLLCVAALSFSTAAASAQAAGDSMIVVSPKEAELREGDAAIGTVPRGGHVRVDEVEPDRLRVSWRGKRGWVPRSEVIPSAEGVRYFTEAIRRDPSPENHLARGDARLFHPGRRRALADRRQILADFDEAVRLAPHDPRGYFHRGLYWAFAGDRRRAAADYTEAIRLDPGFALAYANRAAMRADDDLDGKLSDLDAAIRVDPGNGDLYSSRAAVWERKGSLEKALADYAEAIRLDPEDWVTLALRGQAYREAGRWDEAIADYAGVTRLQPDFGWAYQRRGEAWLGKGEPAKAAGDFEEAIRREVKDSTLQEGLARAYADLGEFGKAEEQIGQVIAFDPKDDDSVREEMLEAFRAKRPWRPGGKGDAAGPGERKAK